MKPIKEIEIAVAICERDGKILLIQRRDTNPIWDKQWEFPGGKLEAGESPEEAVRREIGEETGLVIIESNFFHLHHHDWELPEKILRVHLHCFHCSVGEGDVKIEEEKAYQHAWPTPTEALKYDSLSANNDILHLFLHARTSDMG
ncbi:MAG TPA: NUDIX domain-containing protein [Patescibacteria group bacterium]|nr:NUDIX domain-containing protein [Patescibacteria group bacterium]